MAEIILTDVKKVYKKGQKPAVADVNLTIKDKEFVVFVGPSGCGKSTTLRMIAGLEDISDGTIEIDGIVVNDFQPKDRGVAMVFQNYALYPNMTVFKNIAFPLTLLKIPTVIKKRNGKEVIKRKKLPADEIKKRVIAVAETLGITEYLNRRPRELSGGQRQRVAIGRAMVRDSKVFLLDEPLSNLDAKLRNEMRAELIELRSKINSTFVYVTHDQTEAMTLGDRIVVMRDGHIQQVGTPTEVFDMPANLFVAGFIGSPQMNLFKTRLERDDNGYYVSPCGVKIYVNGEKGEALKNRNTEEQEITLGVRPEHIALTKRDDPTAIPCTVRVKEMMGSELHIHAVTSTGEQIIARIPTMRLTLQQMNMFSDGVEAYITFREKAMHFFGERENNLLVDGAYIPPQEENTQETAAFEEEPQKQKRKHWRHMKSEGDKEKL